MKSKGCEEKKYRFDSGDPRACADHLYIPKPGLDRVYRAFSGSGSITGPRAVRVPGGI